MNNWVVWLSSFAFGAGCTGARQVATLVHYLRALKAKSGAAKPLHGVVSMCIGTGMGAAAVIDV